MYKIEQTNDCIIIQYNGVKITYPKKGVNNFLISYALDRDRKLAITTNQYNRLLGEYNTLLRICHNNSIVDPGFWDKNKEYKADWQMVESEEL